MGWFVSLSRLNLIEVLNYYLMLAFLASTILRLRNYRAILGLIVAFPHRWPNLLALVKQHRTLFLRWPTLLPVGLTLALMLTNAWASHFVWANAHVTIEDLGRLWVALVAVVMSGGVMIFLDCKVLFTGGRFDRAALEVDLDKAEHWMHSWKAPAVRVMTLGLLNPRKIVGERIREALVRASLTVNGQMWLWAFQTAARLAFGLGLWMTWALALRGSSV